MAERNAEKDGRTDATECPNSSKSNTTTEDSNPTLGTNQDDSAMLANSKAVLRSKQSLKKIPFTVCHWNCGSGLCNKLDDIQLAINELKPTVLFITEADRKLIHDEKLIQIRNYQLHNAESLGKHGKSRIIAYTRIGENLKRRCDLESPDSEVIIFDRTNTSNVDRIIGLYRPFTGPDGDKTSGGTWDRLVHLLQIINKALDGCTRATIMVILMLIC